MLPNESLCKCIPGWIRFILYAASLILGFVLCSVSIGKCDNKVIFYICWVLGTLGAALGTMFIKSPQKQYKHMTRNIDNIICNVLILVCFIINILVEVWVPKWYALFVPYLIMYVALIWYSLSIIPCVQNMMKGCCKGCFSCLKSKK